VDTFSAVVNNVFPCNSVSNSRVDVCVERFKQLLRNGTAGRGWRVTRVQSSLPSVAHVFIAGSTFVSFVVDGGGVLGGEFTCVLTWVDVDVLEASISVLVDDGSGDIVI
jgi:hypothetical protein